MRARADGGTRHPTAAGSFYPADPDELRTTVDGLLMAAETIDAPFPRAIVVPHAGYVYSGPVAATAYAGLRPHAERIARVALFGPAHFVPLRGAAVPRCEIWRTPLGPVPVDPDLRQRSIRAGARADDGPHEPEHALEVQVPFLQRVLGEKVSILPTAVGRGGAEEAARIMEAVWEDADLVVVSTDLSHYLDHETARARDRRTADAVLARDPAAIGPENACGAFALRGILELARRRDLPIRLLDLRTSADTAGDPARVVGYGAFAVGG